MPAGYMAVHSTDLGQGRTDIIDKLTSQIHIAAPASGDDDAGQAGICIMSHLDLPAGCPCCKYRLEARLIYFRAGVQLASFEIGSAKSDRRTETYQ